MIVVLLVMENATQNVQILAENHAKATVIPNVLAEVVMENV